MHYVQRLSSDLFEKVFNYATARDICLHYDLTQEQVLLMTRDERVKMTIDLYDICDDDDEMECTIRTAIDTMRGYF